MRRLLLALGLLCACAAAAQIPAQAAEALAYAQTPPALPGSRTPPAMPARGTVQVAFTPWDNAEGMIIDGIRRAKHQILVQSFSFTSRTLANALMAAKRRGVDVQVMADREQTFSGEASRIPDLVQAGIPVMLELRYQSAHNKVMVIDAGTADAAVVTGSYNWTYAAQNKNAENVLILRHNPDVANAYAANWRRHFADALPYAAQ
ncbi:MAG: phospholipase D family protein [Betaproteobacteria bacterium]|nr:phospholipase D family protein [Betaproteobacteria bacterium]